MDSVPFVDDPETLSKFALELRGRDYLFVDTEFESNRGGSRLALVQIATDSTAFVVDALRLADLGPLREAFADATWVVHAGAQDVPLLMHALGLEAPPTVFDTQVAFALLGPEASVSLHYLVYRLSGRRMTKAHQLDDWLQRPLSGSMLSYALDDVLVLRDVFPELLRRLEAAGTRPYVEEATRETLFTRKPAPPPLTLADFRNAWLLDSVGQRALRALVAWHEALPTAERIDTQPQKVLLAIASRAPRTQDELVRIKGLPSRIAGRHARELLACVADAVAHGADADFVPIEPMPYATWEQLDLDSWLTRTRYEVCSELGIAMELALPMRILQKVGEALSLGRDADQATRAIDGWRAHAVRPAFARRCASAGRGC